MVVRDALRWLAEIDGRRYYFILLAGTFLIAGANVLDLLMGRPSWMITKSIFMGFEQTVSTWWSSVLLASAGVMAYWCFRTSYLRNIRPAYGWLLLAVLLLSLSCDEVASLHESWGDFLSKQIAPDTRAEWKHTGWQVVLGPMALVIAVAGLFVIRSHLVGGRLPGLLMLVGAAILLGSGIGLESTTEWLNHNELQWLWDLEIVLEETGEMLGAWLIGLGLVVRGEQLAGRIGLPAN